MPASPSASMSANIANADPARADCLPRRKSRQSPLMNGGQGSSMAAGARRPGIVAGIVRIMAFALPWPGGCRGRRAARVDGLNN